MTSTSETSDPNPESAGPTVPPQGGSGTIVAPPKVHRVSGKRRILLLAAALVIVGIASGAWLIGRMMQPAKLPATQSSVPSSDREVPGTIPFDPTHEYGNKYANGLLPVGDQKYVTDAPQKGSVYLCKASFVPEGQASAQMRGPWFANNNTQWNVNKKTHVKGSIDWEQQMSIKIVNGKRVITTNALPDHQTGTFPVSSADPTGAYDRNPNAIKSQSLVYNLSANPKVGKPRCMGSEAGIMLTGAPLFNAFDVSGRDAGAWEVQDNCDGHPQKNGEYHYHTLSRCIANADVYTVVGFALDGLPITGPKIDENNYLTTDDLDECHGIVGTVQFDSKTYRTYHYVMTQDFPYSVSCFRATAVQSPSKP